MHKFTKYFLRDVEPVCSTKIHVILKASELWEIVSGVTQSQQDVALNSMLAWNKTDKAKKSLFYPLVRSVHVYNYKCKTRGKL